MRPEQVQDAVRRDVPVLMAAGFVEHHGPHLPIGTVTLIASAVCERAERRAECVLMPPLAMAPIMAWAAGPEEGEIDFDPEVFFVSVASTSYTALSGSRRAGVLMPQAGSRGGRTGDRAQVGDRLGAH